MIPPPASIDSEQQRIAALRSYGILDTPREPEFDELVARTIRETGYPTALLTLMDESRCWFKATAGLKPGDAHLRELPRNETFCNYAFRSSGIFVVRDAPADERFAHLAVVNRPDGYRAYAGAQLIDPADHSLGTLCILDDQPRDPTDAERAALRRLANEAMVLLEARRRRLGGRSPSGAPIAIVADDNTYVRIAAAEMMKHLGSGVWHQFRAWKTALASERSSLDELWSGAVGDEKSRKGWRLMQPAQYSTRSWLMSREVVERAGGLRRRHFGSGTSGGWPSWP